MDVRHRDEAEYAKWFTRLGPQARAVVEIDMTVHPDPVTARLLADDLEAAAAYKQLRPRYDFIGAVVQARHERGWTQEQLAEAIGTTQSAVARLERGDQDPRLSTMYAVCQALDLPLTIGKPLREAG